MDTFLNGWVQQQFTTNYNILAAPAQKDNAKWNGGDPALGYKCAFVLNLCCLLCGGVVYSCPSVHLQTPTTQQVGADEC